MKSLNEAAEPRIRGLVSLEGDKSMILTQLRLLPPSLKSMVLPPLSSEIDLRGEVTSFSPRSFIRIVYEVLSRRIHKARSFLESSSRSQPRLVFMNGGSLSARMICITAICDKITKGNIREAEQIFDQISKEGIVGLMRQNSARVKDESRRAFVADVLDGRLLLERQEVEMLHEVNDPAMVAMKAANALDRESAALQPDTADVFEDFIAMSPSTSSGDNPLWTSPDMSKPWATEQLDATENAETCRIQLDTKRDTFAPRRNLHKKSGSVSTEGLNSRDALQRVGKRVPSPWLDRRMSAPPTPSKLHFDEGSGSQRSSSTKLHKRACSADRPSPRIVLSPSLEELARTLKSLQPLESSQMEEGRIDIIEILPQSIFTSQLEEPAERPAETEAPKNGAESAFADPARAEVSPGGSEAGDVKSSHTLGLRNSELYQHVFAIVEQLIIHLSVGNNSEIFESVIRSYKQGGYPNGLSQGGSIRHQPISPANLQPSRRKNPRPLSESSLGSENHRYHFENEINSTNSGCFPSEGRRLWPRYNKYDDVPNIVPDRLGTPNSILSSLSQQTYEPAAATSTAVGVQDSIRALLNVHFPPQKTKYTQYTYPAENDRFWKPVFSKDNSRANDSRTVNQIIALGHEDGTDQKFCKEISERIEKLGIGRARGKKSRTLDIRYLVIHAMQTFTTQPLCFQADENPLTQPNLLATLLIPHLESYLSSHEPTSLLLLQYPPSHLSTILALRELIGCQTMKIARIVNSFAAFPTSSQPNSSVSLPMQSPISLQKATQAPECSSPSEIRSEGIAAQPSSTKADFLLSSRATETEISKFLISISLTLPNRTSFYITSDPRSSTISSGQIDIKNQPDLPTQPQQWTPSHLRRNSLRNSSSSSHHNSISFSTDIPGTESDAPSNSNAQAAFQMNKSKLRPDPGPEMERDNFPIGVGVESDEEDEIERRLMPRLSMQGAPTNSKKALKWLGIS